MNEQTKNIQKYCLLILEEIIRICENNNIKYYLVGGSALGAYRHNGFIPWDDDIDIGIERLQYEKFLEICKEQLDSKFFVQDFSIDNKLVFPYAKIRMNNTAFVENYLSHINMHHGIFIDVFPLDYLVENNIGQVIQTKGIKLGWFLRQIKLDLVKSSKFKIFVANIINKFVTDRIIYKIFNTFSTLSNEKKSNTLVNFVGAYSYKKEAMGKEIFGEGQMLKFENLTCRVPAKIDVYLSNLYGNNYMELPPLEKRVTHSPLWISFEEEYVPKEK